jgi:hypothetical protein
MTISNFSLFPAFSKKISFLPKFICKFRKIVTYIGARKVVKEMMLPAKTTNQQQPSLLVPSKLR